MMERRKILLMGRHGSGKTAMRCMIFSGLLPQNCRQLCTSIEVEQSSLRFAGGLLLNLWDCGGQNHFYEWYLDSQRDEHFRGVDVLVYVFDIQTLEVEAQRDLEYFEGSLQALEEKSPNARIFCLVHKMDLVAERHLRGEVFDAWKTRISEASPGTSLEFFPTSIWDETLFRAWSSIVYSLIPNVGVLESHLEEFCHLCDADEVVLFERATFLVLAHATAKNHPDPERFEKVSNIIKQYKLNSSNWHALFNSMEVGNSTFKAYIEKFTPNTYIMVILSRATPMQTETVQINIDIARQHFEQLVSKCTRQGE